MQMCNLSLALITSYCKTTTSEGRDVDHQNDDGLTPLHVGTMAGNLETLRLLPSSGGNLAIVCQK